MTRLQEAFTASPRDKFLRQKERASAEWDVPLPIGYGQTNSQPSTVQLMLEWLQVLPGQKVLDVGSGSGWTSALLAHLVGKTGRVVATEKVPELVEFGRQNCRSLDIENVEFHQSGDIYGWPDGGPYDRILVSASAKHLPSELIGQLAENGRMVIPVRDTMYVVRKDSKGGVSHQEYPGFAFVPLMP